MLLMSTSMVFCQNLVFSKRGSRSQSSFYSHNSSISVVQFGRGRRKSCGLNPNAKKRHSKRIRWWQRFFLEDDGNWFGLKDDDMLDGVESVEGSSDDELSENEKFEAWKRRAEAIIELREAQEDAKNEENRRWEDWLVDGTTDDAENGTSWVQDSNGSVRKPLDDVGEDFSELISGRGLIKSVRELVLGREDDDILYEDRVFRYASFNSVLKWQGVQHGYQFAKENMLRISCYKPANSPFPHNLKLSKDEGEALANASIYRRLVGRLLHLTITRPDLSYAVQVLSQFLQHPKQPHLEAAHHVLRCLKGTLGQGLLFESDSELHLKGFCDAYWQLVWIPEDLSLVIAYSWITH